MDWLSLIIKFMPAFFRSKITPICYENYIESIKDIVEKVEEERLLELLDKYITEGKCYFMDKNEIKRLIEIINTLLSLVDKQPGFLVKIFPKWIRRDDKNITDLLRNQFSNYWLWIIALFVLYQNNPECKRLVIKYRLLDNIQHLNEYSLDEFGDLPSDTNIFYLSESKNTPKGNFLLHKQKVLEILESIKKSFSN